MVKSQTTYPIEVLRKSRAVLEANIKGAPGMIVSPDATLHYQRQIRELNKAIEYLEIMEANRKRKRDMALSK
ncbi:MAG: hypothetical protein JSS76_07705 [Bacteroidetes bacterium]|nr:hypothetical protein [Bacteroidota bacterium]MBS1684621.1 hypothetical protein [Bacteroidota bacterium]